MAFQSLYARASTWEGSDETLTEILALDGLTELDRWAISQATRLARDVDQALEQFDTQRAGRFIAEYVDDLSNWYVRRSRRRFATRAQSRRLGRSGRRCSCTKTGSLSLQHWQLCRGCPPSRRKNLE